MPKKIQKVIICERCETAVYLKNSFEVMMKNKDNKWQVKNLCPTCFDLLENPLTSKDRLTELLTSNNSNIKIK